MCSASPGYDQPNPGCPSLVQQGECWPNVAPCGVTQFEQIVNTDTLGVAFSENAWATAQQEGCLGCPQRYVDPMARQFPQWPEPAIYQQLDTPSQLITGSDPDMAIDETPYLQDRVMAHVYDNPAEFADPHAFPVMPSLPSLPSLPSPPLLPEVPSAPMPIEATPEVRTAAEQNASITSPEHALPFVGYGLRGIAYHLSHFSQVPRDSFLGKVQFVFLDEDRWKALVGFLAIVLGGALVLWAMFPSGAARATNPYMRIVHPMMG